MLLNKMLIEFRVQASRGHLESWRQHFRMKEIFALDIGLDPGVFPKPVRLEASSSAYDVLPYLHEFRVWDTG